MLEDLSETLRSRSARSSAWAGCRPAGPRAEVPGPAQALPGRWSTAPGAPGDRSRLLAREGQEKEASKGRRMRVIGPGLGRGCHCTLKAGRGAGSESALGGEVGPGKRKMLCRVWEEKGKPTRSVQGRGRMALRPSGQAVHTQVLESALCTPKCPSHCSVGTEAP